MQTIRSMRVSPRAERGLTLVELMVAMTMSLVVLLALVTLLVNTSRANTELAKTNFLIDDGRIAIQVVSEDLMHAGFWGGYLPNFDNLTYTDIPDDYPTAIPNPCQQFAAWNGAYQTNLLGIAVQADDALPTGPGCLLPLTKKANTDVLVIRHIDTCIPGTGNCEADVAGKVYFQNPFCETEKYSTRYVLGTAGYSLHRRDCVTLADKRRFVSNIYYVTDTVQNGVTVPVLVRSQLDLLSGTVAQQAPTPLIDGVDSFRVILGIDDISKSGQAVNYGVSVEWADPNDKVTAKNRGDGVPDSFVHCTTAEPCSVAQLSNVVSAKLFVLTRAKEATAGYSDTKTYCLGELEPNGSCDDDNKVGPFNDGFKRHVFTTTVHLTNISGRRDTP